MRGKKTAELTIASSQFGKEEAFWLEKMAGDLPGSGFTCDYWASEDSDRTLSRTEFQLPSDLFERVLKITGENDARIHIVLTTALAALLFRYNGEPDVMFGVPVYQQDLDSSGELINTVIPIRIRVDGQWSFKELLMRLRGAIIEAMDHANYPVETLLYQLDLPFDGQNFPLFDVGLLLENIHRREDIAYVNPRLLFRFRRSGGECSAVLEYRAENYHPESIQMIVHYFIQVLRAGVTDVNGIVADLPLVDEAGKERLMDYCNGESLEFPAQKTVVDCFLQRMNGAPDSVALVDMDTQVTYRQLSLKAAGIAGELRRLGLRRGELTPVIMDRCAGLVAVMLGIIMAGGAYLPVDSRNRKGRTLFILRDSGARFLFAEAHTLETLDLPGGSSVPLDPGAIADRKEVPIPGDEGPDPGDSLYAIYTSGSTGLPKGVLVRHQGFVNLVHSHIHIFGNTHADRFSQVASPGFDAMAFETWPALLCGAALYMAPQDCIGDPEGMIAWLLSRRISITFQSTRMAELLLSREWPAANVPVKILRTAGDTLNRFPPPDCPFEVYNLYGPTEDTVWTTWGRVTADGAGYVGKPAIGRPVPNKRVFVVGKENRLSPVGVPGELCIAGEGLALGYLNRPRLTADKFVHLDGDINERVYRSGDLARWIPDGNLEFLGRVDNQVKIRGYRIEPGEIESCLKKIAGVKEAVVIPVENPNRELHLCAYVVAGGDVAVEGLKTQLSHWLPDYMIPSLFVTLDSIPLNASGKVDRKGLPKPDWSGGHEYVAPRDHIERALAGMWSDVLHIEKETIGIDADFLDLGGHSISATVLAANIRKHFNVSIPLGQIFEKPFIRDMAAFISSRAPESVEPLTVVEKSAHYQLSSAQNRLYIMQMMDEANTVYNVPGIIKLEGKLDIRRLERVFEELIRRHESLRTYFAWVDGGAVQLIAESVPFSIDCFSAGDKCEEELIRDFTRPFDLKSPPLMRVALASSAGDRHLLMVDLHHVVSDGVSLGILIREFMELYAGKSPAPLKYQYKDFAHWQNRLFQSKRLEAQERFWLDIYKDKGPDFDIPTDLPRPEIRKYSGRVVRRVFPLDFGKNIHGFTRRYDTTLYMLLMAVYNVVAAKLCRREDIVVGSPVTGRTHADVQNIVGMFVNMLALRNRPATGKTFLNFLSEVKENALDAFENQDYQFEDLVRKLGIVRENNRNPLFNVVFQLDDLGVQELKIGDLEVEFYDVQEEACQFDLILAAFTDGQNVRVNLTYATELFKRSTAEKVLDCLEDVLRRVMDSPDITIGELLVEHGGMETSTLLDSDDDSDFGF